MSRLLRVPRACARLLRLLVHLAWGLCQVVLRFPRLSPEQRQQRVQAWSLGLLACAGITLQVRGVPVARGPALLVANHRSWLDIPVLHAARYCRFVSKSDVQGWPILGALAGAAGTLYIERTSRRETLRMVACMRSALQQGEVLAVFPEGTTGDGSALLAFHGNLLQAALDTDAVVQPVGLRFSDSASGASSNAANFVGDDTLAGSVWRTLTARSLTVVAYFGEPEHGQGRHRRAWSTQLRTRVEQLLRDEP